MNGYEMRHFLALAECLNFRRASKLCHLSPSALTRSIQRLEEEVGGALFIRDNRSVKLSEAGEMFRQYADDAVRGWDDVCGKIRSLHGEDGVTGKLRLYASVTAVYSLLPELLERYRAAYPEVQLDLNTGVAEEAMQLVRDGAADVAVAALPSGAAVNTPNEAGLLFLPLTRTKLLFVTSQSRQDWPRQKGKLDMAETPLVLPRGGLARQRLDQWLLDNQVRPNVVAEVSGNEGILSMVRLGSGIGLVPELVLERSPFRDEVCTIKRAPQLEPYTVGLCTSEKNLTRNSVRALWAEGGGS